LAGNLSPKLTGNVSFHFKTTVSITLQGVEGTNNYNSLLIMLIFRATFFGMHIASNSWW